MFNNQQHDELENILPSENVKKYMKMFLKRTEDKKLQLEKECKQFQEVLNICRGKKYKIIPETNKTKTKIIDSNNKTETDPQLYDTLNKIEKMFFNCADKIIQNVKIEEKRINDIIYNGDKLLKSFENDIAHLKEMRLKYQSENENKILASYEKCDDVNEDRTKNKINDTENLLKTEHLHDMKNKNKGNSTVNKVMNFKSDKNECDEKNNSKINFNSLTEQSNRNNNNKISCSNNKITDKKATTINRNMGKMKSNAIFKSVQSRGKKEDHSTEKQNSDLINIKDQKESQKNKVNKPNQVNNTKDKNKRQGLSNISNNKSVQNVLSECKIQSSSKTKDVENKIDLNTKDSKMKELCSAIENKKIKNRSKKQIVTFSSDDITKNQVDILTDNFYSLFNEITCFILHLQSGNGSKNAFNNSDQQPQDIITKETDKSVNDIECTLINSDHYKNFVDLCEIFGLNKTIMMIIINKKVQTNNASRFLQRLQQRNNNHSSYNEKLHENYKTCMKMLEKSLVDKEKKPAVTALKSIYSFDTFQIIFSECSWKELENRLNEIETLNMQLQLLNIIRNDINQLDEQKQKWSTMLQQVYKSLITIVPEIKT